MTELRTIGEGQGRGSAQGERELLHAAGVVLVERVAPSGAAREFGPSDGYEITLVGEGKCELSGGDRRIHAGKGDLSLLRPGDRVAFLPTGGEPLRLLTLRCPGALVERLLGQEFRQLLAALPLHFASISPSAQRASDILHELRLREYTASPSDTLLVHARVLALLAMLFSPEARTGSDLNGTPTALGKREAVADLADSMDGLDLSEMRAERLAARLNLSLRHFTRLFRDRTGKSFTQYVTDIRIQRAKRLLVSTDQKLIVIAQAIGYRSLSQFNLIFKRSTGLSPNQYRRTFQSRYR